MLVQVIAQGRPVVTMPGKMGDLLLALPVAREIAAMHRAPVALVTSHYCAPVLPLLARCSFIASAVVLPRSEYHVEHTDFGAQPWLMPVVAEPAENIYHLGFRHFPLPGQPVSWLAGEPYVIRPEPGAWLPLVRRDPNGPIAFSWEGTEPAWLREWLRALCRPVRRITAFAEPLAECDELVRVRDYHEIHEALNGCAVFVGEQSGPSKVAMGAGLPVVWPHREGIEQERWAHPGCDVTTVDKAGRVRRLAWGGTR